MVRFIELSLLFHKSFNFYVFCSISHPRPPLSLPIISPSLMTSRFSFLFLCFHFPNTESSPVINLRLDACPNMLLAPFRWFIGSVFDSLSFHCPPPPHWLSRSIISCVPRLGKTTGPIFPSTWFYVKHFRSLMIWLISLPPRAIFVRPPKRPRKTQFLWFLSSMVNSRLFRCFPFAVVCHSIHGSFVSTNSRRSGALHDSYGARAWMQNGEDTSPEITTTRSTDMASIDVVYFVPSNWRR